MLNPPNRRGTDPYARWCGRGGIARCPPIPIDSDRAADAAQPAMPSIAVARSHTTEDHVPTGVSCTLGASATVPNLHQLDGRDPRGRCGVAEHCTFFATRRRGIIAAQSRVEMLGRTAHLSPIRIPYRKFREDS
jgi:hypothetical protein